MRKRIIENVGVDALSPFTNKAAARFEMGGLRYHVWFDINTLQHEGILYKRSPEGLKPRDRGYFEPKKLDATNGTNAPLVAGLFEKIKIDGLLDKAKAEHAAAEAAEQAKREAEWREGLKQQAGPALYDALTSLAGAAAVVNDLQHAGAPIPADAWADLFQATTGARAALALAQVGEG
jgi:hypothetical protein